MLTYLTRLDRVEVFFMFHPHANRMFHQPTFMTYLTLSPNHPRFPIAGILHAICALACSYTASVPWAPLGGCKTFTENVFCLSLTSSTDNGFSETDLLESRSETFAAEHAVLADQNAEVVFQRGQDFLSVLQGIYNIIYWECNFFSYCYQLDCCYAFIIAHKQSMCPLVWVFNFY